MQKSKEIKHIVSTENLSKHFITASGKPVLVLNNLSIKLYPYHIYYVVGANGCGKSTLIKVLAQIENYDKGSLVVNQDLEISYVAQSLVFDDRLTVYENYFFYKMLDQNFKSLTLAKRQEVFKNDLEIFGLQKHSQTKIGNLSFGMRKKLQLMLCLKIDSLEDNPALWLLDEADVGLDKAGKSLYIQLITKMLRKKSAIVIVTHNKSEILAMLKHEITKAKIRNTKFQTISLDKA